MDKNFPKRANGELAARYSFESITIWYGVPKNGPSQNFRSWASSVRPLNVQKLAQNSNLFGKMWKLNTKLAIFTIHNNGTSLDFKTSDTLAEFNV
jgi:hypothetical protein